MLSPLRLRRENPRGLISTENAEALGVPGKMAPTGALDRLRGSVRRARGSRRRRSVGPTAGVAQHWHAHPLSAETQRQPDLQLQVEPPPEQLGPALTGGASVSERDVAESVSVSESDVITKPPAAFLLAASMTRSR